MRESNDVYEEVEALAARVGHHGAAWSARRNRFAGLAAQAADLVELGHLADAQTRAARETGIRGWAAYAHILRGILAFWRGDWTAAREEMEKGVRLTDPGLWWFGTNHGFLIMLLASAGEREAAYNVLDQVRDALPRLGRANTVGAWCLASLAAEATRLMDDAPSARMLYPIINEALKTGTLMRFYDGGLLERSAAMAAAAAGLDETARDHFETALRQAEELPHLMERPQVQHFYAHFLMERAGRDEAQRARGLLEEALAGYHSIGKPRHEAMARELFSRCG